MIEAAEHEVPENTSSWWYIFGSGATVLLVLQVMTGILLALVYTPSASHAWSSLEFLDHNVKLGWFLRAMHGWGSDFMIAVVLIHMAQVFMFGAYKFPRELTWIIGVFLLLLTLGMAFTGQVSAVRSGCLLGAWHRGFDREPRAGGWRLAGRYDAGRADHCRAYADAVFCAACVCHSGDAAGAGRAASLDGPAAWH